jgi:hypothetical protein
MSETEVENPFEKSPVIFQYTRAQALADGVLVDLTEWAKKTGFKVPVACTAAVWNGYVMPTERTRALGQSERGRAHDLLWMLFNAVRKQEQGDSLLFKVMFLQTPERRILVEFKAVCGPGDDAEPAVTIMLPGED